MTTFKDLEDNLKQFLVEEQSDVYNSRSLRPERYNNLKIWMELRQFNQPHFFVRITMSEAVYSIEGCNKLKGGLGQDERYVRKWHSRMGIKDKLSEIWFNLESQDVNGNTNANKKSVKQ